MKNLIRTVIFAFMSVFLVSNVVGPAFASEQIFTMDDKKVKLPTTKILFNGQYLETDMPAVILNDRTLVPVRAISESMGATVKWDDKNYTVNITKDNTDILLKINSKYVTVNGTQKTLPDGVPAKLINDTTMVPVRFISEELGAEVGWDKAKSEVVINTKKEVPIETSISFDFKIEDGSDVFTIKRDKNTQYKNFCLDSPNRLVFDISNANLKDDKEYIEQNLNEKYINSYKANFYKEEARTRVTLVLSEDVKQDEIQIFNKDNDIMVMIKKEEIDKNDNTGTDTDIDTTDVIAPNREDGKYVIVVDAGHGGSDPGAISKIDRTKEKDLTLSISNKLNEKLQQEGFETIMTRESDTYPSLSDRYNLANSNNADLFISVHINSADASVKGIETLYYPNTGSSAKGRDNKKLAKCIQDEMIKSTNAVDRKTKERPNLAVLKGTNMPAVIVECGFLTNSAELELMKNDQYQDKLVEGIVNGIQKYIGK